MRRALPTLLAFSLILGMAGCGSDGDDDQAASTTTTTAPEAIPEETEPDRTEDRTRLVIAPVLASGGCAATADGTATDGATEEGEEPTGEGPYPTADGVFCYTVGQPIADGNDLTDATLSEAGGGFQVFTRVKADSVDELDAQFDACFTGQPVCPAGEGGRGYVAIIWEGVVLYAPAVASEDLAAEGLSLAGGLTERRARELITLINR